MSLPSSKTVLMDPVRDPRHDDHWTISDLKRIDAACEEFERSWLAGSPFDLTSFIGRGQASTSRLLFRELLAVDIEYRIRRGEQISPPELGDQFPEYQDIVGLVCAEALPPASVNEAVPAMLAHHPRYEITGRLGMGGMGTVYAGRHTVLGREVAIKVIRSDLLTAAGARERFLREARTAARLQHPNVVAVYDAEATDAGQFLVMEAVSGADLAKTVAEFGPLTWDAACDAIHQAALGLEAAWQIGMVHRDLSPRNLMLADDGTVKLLDFGLASLSSAGVDQLLKPGMLVGSPAFMAPEQVDDPSASDVRSDLYSLGCVMYFLLTGTPPFPIASLPELLDSHRHQLPPDLGDTCPDLPVEVAAIVRRLLAKAPDDRFQTPSELAMSLERIRDGVTTDGPFGPNVERNGETPPRDRMAGSRSPDPFVRTREVVLAEDGPKHFTDRPARPNLGVRTTGTGLVAGLVAITVLVAILAYREYPGRGNAQAVTESPEFVQGLSMLAQRQERQVRLAIDKFQGILAREPRNARAHAALAQAYNLCGDYGWELPDTAFPKAIAAGQRSLELDPHLAEGRLALAFAAATYTCDWQDAERQYLLTLEAAPDLPAAHHWFAWFLVQQGRFDEARIQIDRAQSLAPDNLIIVNNIGKILYFSRDYTEAVNKHRAALDLDQDFQKAHMDLGYALIELGQIDEALVEFDRSAGISARGWDVRAARAFALARQGKANEVQLLLQSLEPVAESEGLSLEMTHIYAAMGDFDQAFRWLGVAFHRKSPGRAGIAIDPRIDPLRNDPRLAPLLKSINLNIH